MTQICKNISDVQFISQSQPLQDLRKGEEGMTLVAVLSRPKTRAELILWSADPKHPPVHSDLQYPTDQEDKETLARALDIMSKVSCYILSFLRYGKNSFNN